MAAKRVECRTNDDKRHNRQGRERHSKHNDGRGATGSSRRREDEGIERCINLSYQLRARRTRLCMVGSRSTRTNSVCDCICWSAGHDPARIPQIQDPPIIKAVQCANSVVLAYIRHDNCIAAWMSEVIILPIPMIIACGLPEAVLTTIVSLCRRHRSSNRNIVKVGQRAEGHVS